MGYSRCVLFIYPSSLPLGTHFSPSHSAGEVVNDGGLLFHPRGRHMSIVAKVLSRTLELVMPTYRRNPSREGRHHQLNPWIQPCMRADPSFVVFVFTHPLVYQLCKPVNFLPDYMFELGFRYLQLRESRLIHTHTIETQTPCCSNSLDIIQVLHDLIGVSKLFV